MPQDDVSTLRLPLSGLVVQCRRDGRWRCLTQAQLDDEASDGLEAVRDDWASAEVDAASGGRAQVAPGSTGGAGWWLLYGDPRNGPAEVPLADGRRPRVVTFGPLWLCEWVSPWQEAYVTVAGQSHRAFHRRPAYVKPPA